MELTKKLKYDVENLEKGMKDFKLALDADLREYNAKEQDWIKNAQIQKFEFCIELFWKTCKVYFQIQGLNLLTPKENIKQLYVSGHIDEPNYLQLLASVDARNLLSHIYNKETFNEINQELPEHYNAINVALIQLNKIMADVI